MKTIIKFIPLCILFICCTNNAQIQKKHAENQFHVNDTTPQSLSELYGEYLIQFKSIVDSINQSLNTDYGYKYNVVAFRKSFSSPNLFKKIPYFGMSDGKEAFLYSLHLRELTEVKFKIVVGNTYIGNNDNGTFYHVQMLEKPY